MKKISIFLVSLFFCILPLTACTPSEKTVIRVNEVTHSVFYAPLYLADALGYFEDAGFSIELTNGGGADATMAAVLSDSADIGFCGPEAALYVLVGGSTNVPMVFGQLTKRDGSFLVGRTAEPDFTWQNLAGKEILAGRKGGVPAMTFEYTLNQNGLYDGKDVTLNFDVAFNLMTSAFEAGVADYCTMFEPTATEYQNAGKGYIVTSVGESSGEVPYTCFIAKQTWIDQNEETVRGFLTAITKATKYINEHSAEEVAALLVPYFDGTSEASLAIAVESYRNIDAWMTNMAMTEDSFTRLQDIIENAGELTRRASLSELVINTYAEEAYKTVYN